MSFASALERELGAARQIIDANSNSTLTQPPPLNTYRTSYTPNNFSAYTTNSYTNLPFPYIPTPTPTPADTYESKKALNDLQDELRILKKDLEKKDELVKELSSFRDAHRHVHFDSAINQDRFILDGARREAEQNRYKIDGLAHDLREVNIKLSAKDERINELKQENDSLKRDYELVIQKNHQLNQKIRDLETNVNSYDTVANKSSLTIASLQRDAKEKQDQILELQSRLRNYVDEREFGERKTNYLQAKLQELFASLSVTLGESYGQPSAASFDQLLSKIADINADNVRLKGKMVQTEEKDKLLEKEVEDLRTTIQRMSKQLETYDSSQINHRLNIDSIKAERDTALYEKDKIKQELEVAKSRLESVQKAWENTRGELDLRENKFSSNELQVKQIENDLNYQKSCFEAFKQQMSQLLSDGYIKVDPKEEEIKEKVQLLMQSSKDRGFIITNLQKQKEELAKQLQDQLELNKDSDKRRRHHETHLFELEQKVKNLNVNQTNAELYQETFKQDKTKFLHFLQRLCSVLRIEHDPNFDLNPERIIQRAEQLMQWEKNSVHEQKISVYNLQRKNQQFKEQLDQKDEEINRLKAKFAAFECTQTIKSDLEKEIDDHVVLSKKMKSKLEQLTQQINQLKFENNQLKSQTNDVQILKDRLNEREKEMKHLLTDLEKLESIRDKQATKISMLQEKLLSNDDQANRSMNSSDNVVRTLSNELRFLKGSLQQYADREQRLLDFRALVARMLGLDVKTLPVPDYEITARLERLLTVGPPPPVQEPKAIPPRYPHAHSAQGRRRSPPSPNSRRIDGNHRARSVSPLHVGIDPRTY